MSKGLFNLPPRSTKVGDNQVIQKTRNPQVIKPNITIKGGGSLFDKISSIDRLVNSRLGKYKDRYIIIDKEEDLVDYIDKCIENNIVSLDTETDNLDPITCSLAGICIYTPGKKAGYIPVNHISYINGIKSKNQIDEDIVKREIQRLKDNQVKNIFFNAKFDIRVLFSQLGVKLKAYWDGYIAARLLNENEKHNNLKYLHQRYCTDGKEDEILKFDNLFQGIPFTHIPIKTGYLYAARDAEMTYELYEFQKPYLDKDNPICQAQDLEMVAKVYKEIELPLIDVIVDMETTGISFDFEFAEELSNKYTAKLRDIEEEFYQYIKRYDDKIDNYRITRGNQVRLDDPINIASPQQLAVLLYDIVGLTPIKGQRGTGVDILKKLDTELTDIILKYREVKILLSTFIDKMPQVVNPKTSRIHASFNQVGADTGRMSSSEPNMQNIPSRNDEIRKMFKATEGYLMISSDYSAQEPRIMSHMSQDKKMIQAYKDGKDLYVEIASIAFNLPYEECLQFKDGEFYPEGNQRRQTSKAIVLGVAYGKGVPAIADDLGISVRDAQNIYNKIMTEFPGLPNFMRESEEMAATQGFVTTIWGRKRRLPNMQLEKYEFRYLEGKNKNFDPLNFDNQGLDFEVDARTKSRYINQLNRTYSIAEKNKIIARARKEGIEIKDNGGYIAEATRQCVNSRIQGSAADMTKRAMILVNNDKLLKDLGFRLLLSVHDELIGEAPRENAKEAAERLEYLMNKAADGLTVPIVCDSEITERWYGEPLEIK